MNCIIASGNLKVFSRALQALSKLPGEDLYLEAKPEGLFLKTVNASRSGYACFQFSPKFFISFVRGVDTPISDSSLNRRVAFIDHTSENYCKISMKSAVLTLRALTNAETCEIKIAFSESALKITLHFKYGIIRKYSLSLIECEAMQSLFDRNTCKNKVVAPCQTLLEAVHRSFQLNQEEVTLSVNDQEMMFRNFVEDEPDPDKVPKTELRLNIAEFLTFDVHMKSELTFTLKEFRALLHFVEYFHVPIVFLFSEPGKPIIFRLENCGDFSAEYVLATLSPKGNLFLNWSQDSTLFEECEEQDTVLAPDSDLDDK
ncbi:Cell cycle checkpoint control protein RAD9A [Trichinella patagoniensis]|uniref:Cell cycle checkpoint control protein RAD9A n=1 Tax=Trichinella patagoniensis TaxID=990121 RepID=A0A0V1A7I1_9BILA|nr:Cell cycle checkpoint control protein RAD9A [Trichinella patagoniensis]